LAGGLVGLISYGAKYPLIVLAVSVGDLSITWTLRHWLCLARSLI
jgi:hypothetical protein